MSFDGGKTPLVNVRKILIELKAERARLTRAIAALEKLWFNTAHFASFLGRRFMVTPGTDAVTVPGAMPMHPMTQITPLRFLATPDLWIGFAVTAVFLALAVRLRRYRGPN